MRDMGEEMPRYAGWAKRAVVLALIGLLSMTGAEAALAGGGPNVTGAKLYIQQNDMARAIDVLNKELKSHPKNEDAWYLLGYIYARQKKYEQMVEAFNKAVTLKPKLHEKGIKIGKDSGKQFLSRDGVDRIVRVAWGNAFNRGVKYFNAAINATDDSLRTSNFDLAVASFKSAAVMQPDSTLAYRNWAAALLNAGRTEESIVPLKTALEKSPEDVEVKLMLAQVYMSGDKDSLAVPMLEELWTGGRQTEEVAENLSRAYVRSGKIEKAKEIYKSAIEANPDNFQFRYNYGTILLEAQEYDAAIEHLTRAFEIDSSSADINYNLGAAYLNRGVAKREAVAEDSDDRAYLGDFKAAFPFLEKSIAMNPDDEVSWLTLGRIAGQLNKIALAGYAFSKGEGIRTALDKKVVVGMPGETLKAILGAPNKVTQVESVQFSNVEEWAYNERRGTKRRVGIPHPLKVYVTGDRVDAIMVEE